MDTIKTLLLLVLCLIITSKAETSKEEVLRLIRELNKELKELQRGKAEDGLNKRIPQVEGTDDMAFMSNALNTATSNLNGRKAPAEKKNELKQGRMTDDMAFMLSALGGANAALNGRRDVSDDTKREFEERMTDDMAFMMSALGGANAALNGQREVSADKEERSQQRMTDDMAFMLNALGGANAALHGQRDLSDGETEDYKQRTSAHMDFMARALRKAMRDLSGERDVADNGSDSSGNTVGTLPHVTESNVKYDQLVSDLESTANQRSSAKADDAKALITKEETVKPKQKSKDKMRKLLAQFTSLFECAKADESCGILKGKQCCDGFFCKPKGKGRCVEDCVNVGGDCTINENCCAGKCVKVEELLYKCRL